MEEHQLLTALDMAAVLIAEESPELTEDQVALRVIRVNLTAATMQLIKFLELGIDMGQDSLNGFTAGLIETINWMVAKEAVADEWEDIEKAANGNVS